MSVTPVTDRQRPISLTFLGGLFVAVGVFGIVRGLWPRGAADPLPPELASKHALDGLYSAASGMLAMLGGAFVLRGRNWGRWLVVVWLAAHVYLSLLHDPVQLAIHVVVFAVGLYLLFRPAASVFFRGTAPPGSVPDARTT